MPLGYFIMEEKIMKVKELKQILKEMPENAEVNVQDGVGDTFHTITAFNTKNTLTILVEDIIF
jgi:hypothetical protein